MSERGLATIEWGDYAFFLHLAAVSQDMCAGIVILRGALYVQRSFCLAFVLGGHLSLPDSTSFSRVCKAQRRFAIRTGFAFGGAAESPALWEENNPRTAVNGAARVVDVGGFNVEPN